MSIRFLNVKITGVTPLLQHNPQTVDRFNPIARRMSQINSKKTRRTDEDYRELADLEIQAGVYFDDSLGVFVPTRWVMAAYAKHSHSVAKVAKAGIRGSVFTTANEVSLKYKGMDKVKTAEDIVKNPMFRHKMILPQGQVRVAKNFPIFHDWSFDVGMEYDDTQIDPDAMERIIKHAAKYGGFGDFRPTFGRAIAEVEHE